MADTQISGRAMSFGRNSAASIVAGASNCLRLAPTPIFAVVAVIAGTHGRTMPDLLCSAARDASPLMGMTPMYVMMSIFHSPPWLRLIAGPLEDSPERYPKTPPYKWRKWHDNYEAETASPK